MNHLSDAEMEWLFRGVWVVPSDRPFYGGPYDGRGTTLEEPRIYVVGQSASHSYYWNAATNRYEWRKNT